MNQVLHLNNIESTISFTLLGWSAWVRLLRSTNLDYWDQLLDSDYLGELLYFNNLRSSSSQ